MKNKKLVFIALILILSIGLFIAYNIFSNIPVSNSTKPILKVRIINFQAGTIFAHFPAIKDILEEKYDFEATESDDYDLVISGTSGHEPITNKKAFKISYIGEPEPARLEGFDLALGFDYLEDHQNYVRFPLYYISFSNEFLHNNLNMRHGGDKCEPNKPYLACFLVTNGAGEERNHLFHRLSLYKHVASGGAYLNNIGKRVSMEDTSQWLGQCKFVIAYENTSLYPGYITEKVFQAYRAGAIPLYSTHITAQEDINSESIISAQQFNSEEDMVNHIIELDQDDRKYCETWAKPIIANPAENYQNIKDKLRKKLAPLL